VENLENSSHLSVPAMGWAQTEEVNMRFFLMYYLPSTSVTFSWGHEWGKYKGTASRKAKQASEVKAKANRVRRRLWKNDVAI